MNNFRISTRMRTRAIARSKVTVPRQARKMTGRFAIPFTMATTMGLSARALDLPLTLDEADQVGWAKTHLLRRWHELTEKNQDW